MGNTVRVRLPPFALLGFRSSGSSQFGFFSIRVPLNSRWAPLGSPSSTSVESFEVFPANTIVVDPSFSVPCRIGAVNSGLRVPATASTWDAARKVVLMQRAVVLACLWPARNMMPAKLSPRVSPQRVSRLCRKQCSVTSAARSRNAGSDCGALQRHAVVVPPLCRWPRVKLRRELRNLLRLRFAHHAFDWQTLLRHKYDPVGGFLADKEHIAAIDLLQDILLLALAEENVLNRTC